MIFKGTFLLLALMVFLLVPAFGGQLVAFEKDKEDAFWREVRRINRKKEDLAETSVSSETPPVGSYNPTKLKPTRLVDEQPQEKRPDVDLPTLSLPSFESLDALPKSVQAPVGNNMTEQGVETLPTIQDPVAPPLLERPKDRTDPDAKEEGPALLAPESPKVDSSKADSNAENKVEENKQESFLSPALVPALAKPDEKGKATLPEDKGEKKVKVDLGRLSKQDIEQTKGKQETKADGIGVPPHKAKKAAEGGKNVQGAVKEPASSKKQTPRKQGGVVKETGAKIKASSGKKVEKPSKEKKMEKPVVKPQAVTKVAKKEEAEGSSRLELKNEDNIPDFAVSLPEDADTSEIVQDVVPIEISPRRVYDYRSNILPPNISKKQYGPQNQHLPKAFYQKEYSALLFIAVKNADVGGIKALLAKGADINAHDLQNTYTPLMYAIAYNKIDSLRYLVTRGANLLKKTNDGKTALHIAVLYNRLDMIKVLISLGLSPLTLDNSGLRPYDYANVNNQAMIGIAIASQYGNQSQALMDCVIMGAISGVQYALKHGGDLRYRNSSGQTPLMMAVKKSDIAMVNLLLAKGADTEESDAEGRTVLDLAYAVGNQEIVNLLQTVQVQRELVDLDIGNLAQ